MNWNKVRAIVLKEWADAFRNKMVFFSMLFMPLLFTALPLVMLYFLGQTPPDKIDSTDLGPFLVYQQTFHLQNPQDVISVGMASIYIIIFLLLPLILPMMVASDSIVSEKVSKSLEPLLATPITVTELLMGKALAAVGPAVIVTWLFYAIYVGLASLLVSPGVLRVLASVDWIIGIGLLAPLMGLLAVSLGIIVSSRVNDTRAAQQIGGLVVLPVMLIFIPMFLGSLALTATVFLMGAVIFLILDVAAMIIATALFQRETILTRWK
jgi:ABC-2 type transport system permease protein